MTAAALVCGRLTGEPITRTPLSAVGPFSVETYTARDGATKLSFKLTADRVLPLKPTLKAKAAKESRPSRPRSRPSRPPSPWDPNYAKALTENER